MKWSSALTLAIIFFAQASFTVLRSESEINALYNDCDLAGQMDYNVFEKAIKGFSKIERKKKEDFITIIDFAKASTEQRLFLLNLKERRLVLKSLVAHGKNSGSNYAKSFSNAPRSLKSSLGFFLTAETYYGKHGYSLRLDGLEPGLNDNARSRAIVIHGAAYVSKSFAAKHGRIGRSWGCPALPLDNTKAIVAIIKEGNVLYIHANEKEYFERSAYLK